MEQELEQKLKTLQPDSHFDQAFAITLRNQLLSKVPVAPAKPVVSPYRRSPLSVFSLTELRYSAFGALVAVFIVAPLTYVLTSNHIPDIMPLVKNISSGLTPTPQISAKGMNAFGMLSPLSSVSAQKSGTIDVAALSQRTTMAVGGQGTTSTPATRVHASYTGTPISITETQGNVLKRTINDSSAKQLADVVKNANFGLADLSSFPDLTFSTIALKEDKAFGYLITADFGKGEIVIAPDWEKWSTTTPSPRLASAAPSDSFIISIANEFLRNHKIDTGIYGLPVVENKTYTATTDTGASVSYAQDVVTVVYPITLDGSKVYEQEGGVYGLQVSVDIVNKKVSSVQHLTSQVYESSPYELEVNMDDILAGAEKALSVLPEIQQQPSTVEVKLSRAEQVLMHYWRTDTDAMEELYIPALRFEIENSETLGLHQKNIVIPIVSSFLNPVVGNASTTATTTVSIVATSTSALN